MKKTKEDKQRKKLKEYGHTDSYIEWMIWKTQQQ
jgi:hypothetical protein